MIAAAQAKGVDFTWLAAGQAQMTTATSLGIHQKDVMRVGGDGAHMASACKSAGRKSLRGFTATQRIASGGSHIPSID